MAYALSTTNYVGRFMSSCSRATNNSFDQESSWNLYVEDFITTNYDDMEDISSVVSDAESFVDEELEDTATSPVHTPKVNELDCLLMRSMEMDTRQINLHQEKEQGSLHIAESVEKSLLETELRKKGLCLVPVSVISNYLGSSVHVNL